MLTKDFLNTVITSTAPGYFCLALSNGSGAWLEEWHRWPDDVDKIIGRAEKMQHTANVYFSSYLFRAPQSTKENVLPSRTIQADLDDADLNDLPREPAVLVETSPGRHQAYWILSTPAPTLEAHEEISRKITYSIPLCDRSGWPLGRKVRLPDTLNHKYLSGVKPVRIVRTSLKQYEPEEFEALPEVPQFVIDHYDNSFIENPIGTDPATTADTGLELLEAIRPNIPMRVYLQYSVVQADRSEALWALMCWGFKAGLSRGQVFTLARDSANNKFRDLKHRADQDLAKDVLRAEHAVNSNQQDARALIQGIFKTDLPSIDKKRQIFNIVLSELKGAGEFIRTRNGLSWYVRRDVGRPVSITTNSEALHTMLDVQFGMNFTEPETKYVVQGLKSYTGGLPETSVQSALSYYDPEEQHLLIHTGRRDVLRVTRSGMEHGVDGSYNVIFPWSSSVEPFIPAVIRGGDIDWGEELFGKGRRGFGTAVENITNMTPSQAKALLQVWLMFVLFRNIADTRPIIASLGQPGCMAGDTTIEFRRGDHSARSLRIRDAYHNWCTRWDHRIPTRMRSVKDGVIAWRDVAGIVSSGKKLTYHVTVGARKPIRLTLDHRFLTPTGYKALADLSVGDTVLVGGANLHGRGRPGVSRREISALHHPYGREKYVGNYGPYNFVSKARLVLEASLNGLSYSDFVHILRTDERRSRTLQYLDRCVSAHHKNENPVDDRLENLEALTKAEHDVHHGYNNVRNFGAWSGLWSTATSRIMAIEPYGEEDTYDIQMADVHAPNFLTNASGPVLHNSGKTTLFKRVYTFLYGRRKSIGAVTDMDDFDQATSSDPLVILDNVDTWERWLPDRIALSAGTSDVIKRKLYTDTDTITLSRQAVVGVTAHNPKFGREDVADRFLLFTYKRLRDEDFIAEGEILADIYRQRNALWGAVLRDIQKVLSTPMPDKSELPHFRIEDFARFGLWMARALGVERDFRASIEDVKTSQQAFSLEEEGMLVAAIMRFVSKSRDARHYTTSQLWAMLENCCDDPRMFGHVYKNSVQLSKKISAMQQALRRIVRIEQSTNDAGNRTWLITQKEEHNGADADLNGTVTDLG